jgi:hypothetical protein
MSSAILQSKEPKTSAMICENGNDTPNIDSIAKEMLTHDILAFHDFCESLCAGTNTKGGVGQTAFSTCFAPIVALVDEFDTKCSANNVDVEDVTYRNCPTERPVNQSDEGLWDTMLNKVEDNCNFDSFEEDPKPGGSTAPKKSSKRNKRLDKDTLDALARLLAKIPNDDATNDNAEVNRDPGRESSKKSQKNSLKDSTVGSKIRDPYVEDTSTVPLVGKRNIPGGDSVSDPYRVEDTSTTPLVGKRNIPTGVTFPVQVYGFQKLAKEMDKRCSPHLNQSTKVAGTRLHQPSKKHCLLKTSPQNFSSRHKSDAYSVLTEEDWEYLNETVTDPVFTPPPPPPKKKPMTLAGAVRKFLSARRNQLGRYRLIRRRDRISFHKDGSVQVNLAD